MKLKTVTGKTKKLKIELDEGTLNVKYRPGALTAEVEERLIEALDQPGQGKFVNEFVCELIETWDLEDDDDQTIPLTVEGLRPVPLLFLNHVIENIREDMRPGEANSD